MNLSSQKLRCHLNERLQQHHLPVRIHGLFNDLYPRLHQHQQLDVFELFIELIKCADSSPAQYLLALLAVTNDETLTHLDRETVANIAAFVRDTMKLREQLNN